MNFVEFTEIPLLSFSQKTSHFFPSKDECRAREVCRSSKKNSEERLCGFSLDFRNCLKGKKQTNQKQKRQGKDNSNFNKFGDLGKEENTEKYDFERLVNEEIEKKENECLLEKKLVWKKSEEITVGDTHKKYFICVYTANEVEIYDISPDSRNVADINPSVRISTHEKIIYDSVTFDVKSVGMSSEGVSMKHEDMNKKSDTNVNRDKRLKVDRVSEEVDSERKGGEGGIAYETTKEKMNLNCFCVCLFLITEDYVLYKLEMLVSINENLPLDPSCLNVSPLPFYSANYNDKEPLQSVGTYNNFERSQEELTLYDESSNTNNSNNENNDLKNSSDDNNNNNNSRSKADDFMRARKDDFFFKNRTYNCKRVKENKRNVLNLSFFSLRPLSVSFYDVSSLFSVGFGSSESSPSTSFFSFYNTSRLRNECEGEEGSGNSNVFPSSSFPSSPFPSSPSSPFPSSSPSFPSPSSSLLPRRKNKNLKSICALNSNILVVSNQDDFSLLAVCYLVSDCFSETRKSFFSGSYISSFAHYFFNFSVSAVCCNRESTDLLEIPFIASTTSASAFYCFVMNYFFLSFPKSYASFTSLIQCIPFASSYSKSASNETQDLKSLFIGNLHRIEKIKHSYINSFTSKIALSHFFSKPLPAFHVFSLPYSSSFSDHTVNDNEILFLSYQQEQVLLYKNQKEQNEQTEQGKIFRVWSVFPKEKDTKLLHTFDFNFFLRKFFLALQISDKKFKTTSVDFSHSRKTLCISINYIYLFFFNFSAPHSFKFNCFLELNAKELTNVFLNSSDFPFCSSSSPLDSSFSFASQIRVSGFCDDFVFFISQNKNIFSFRIPEEKNESSDFFSSAFLASSSSSGNLDFLAEKRKKYIFSTKDINYVFSLTVQNTSVHKFLSYSKLLHLKRLFNVIFARDKIHTTYDDELFQASKISKKPNIEISIDAKCVAKSKEKNNEFEEEKKVKHFELWHSLRRIENLSEHEEENLFKFEGKSDLGMTSKNSSSEEEHKSENKECGVSRLCRILNSDIYVRNLFQSILCVHEEDQIDKNKKDLSEKAKSKIKEVLFCRWFVFIMKKKLFDIQHFNFFMFRNALIYLAKKFRIRINTIDCLEKVFVNFVENLTYKFCNNFSSPFSYLHNILYDVMIIIVDEYHRNIMLENDICSIHMSEAWSEYAHRSFSLQSYNSNVDFTNRNCCYFSVLKDDENDNSECAQSAQSSRAFPLPLVVRNYGLSVMRWNCCSIHRYADSLRFLFDKIKCYNQNGDASFSFNKSFIKHISNALKSMSNDAVWRLLVSSYLLSVFGFDFSSRILGKKKKYHYELTNQFCEILADFIALSPHEILMIIINIFKSDFEEEIDNRQDIQEEEEEKKSEGKKKCLEEETTQILQEIFLCFDYRSVTEINDNVTFSFDCLFKKIKTLRSATSLNESLLIDILESKGTKAKQFKRSKNLFERFFGLSMVINLKHLYEISKNLRIFSFWLTRYFSDCYEAHEGCEYKLNNINSAGDISFKALSNNEISSNVIFDHSDNEESSLACYLSSSEKGKQAENENQDKHRLILTDYVNLNQTAVNAINKTTKLFDYILPIIRGVYKCFDEIRIENCNDTNEDCFTISNQNLSDFVYEHLRSNKNHNIFTIFFLFLSNFDFSLMLVEKFSMECLTYNLHNEICGFLFYVKGSAFVQMKKYSAAYCLFVSASKFLAFLHIFESAYNTANLSGYLKKHAKKETAQEVDTNLEVEAIRKEQKLYICKCVYFFHVSSLLDSLLLGEWTVHTLKIKCKFLRKSAKPISTIFQNDLNYCFDCYDRKSLNGLLEVITLKLLNLNFELSDVSGAMKSLKFFQNFKLKRKQIVCIFIFVATKFNFAELIHEFEKIRIGLSEDDELMNFLIQVLTVVVLTNYCLHPLTATAFQFLNTIYQSREQFAESALLCYLFAASIQMRFYENDFKKGKTFLENKGLYYAANYTNSLKNFMSEKVNKTDEIYQDLIKHDKINFVRYPFWDGICFPSFLLYFLFCLKTYMNSLNEDVGYKGNSMYNYFYNNYNSLYSDNNKANSKTDMLQGNKPSFYEELYVHENHFKDFLDVTEHAAFLTRNDVSNGFTSNYMIKDLHKEFDLIIKLLDDCLMALCFTKKNILIPTMYKNIIVLYNQDYFMFYKESSAFFKMNENVDDSGFSKFKDFYLNFIRSCFSYDFFSPQIQFYQIKDAKNMKIIEENYDNLIFEIRERILSEKVVERARINIKGKLTLMSIDRLFDSIPSTASLHPHFVMQQLSENGMIEESLEICQINNFDVLFPFNSFLIFINQITLPQNSFNRSAISDMQFKVLTEVPNADYNVIENIWKKFIGLIKSYVLKEKNKNSLLMNILNEVLILKFQNPNLVPFFVINRLLEMWKTFNSADLTPLLQVLLSHNLLEKCVTIIESQFEMLEDHNLSINDSFFLNFPVSFSFIALLCETIESKIENKNFNENETEEIYMKMFENFKCKVTNFFKEANVRIKLANDKRNYYLNKKQN